MYGKRENELCMCADYDMICHFSPWQKLCVTEMPEISSNSDSQSGSSSDSSSDTLSSLGSVDLENEDDDEGLSVCSVDSDSQRGQAVSRKIKVRHSNYWCNVIHKVDILINVLLYFSNFLDRLRLLNYCRCYNLIEQFVCIV